MTSNFRNILAAFLVLGIMSVVIPYATASYEVIINTSDTQFYLNNTIPDNSENDSGILINASNVLVDCNGYNISGIDIDGSYGIYVGNASNVTIQNCYIKDMGFGIYFYDVNDSTIVNTTFNDTKTDSITLNGRNDTIINNIIENSGSSIMGIRIYSTEGYHNIFHNTISMNGADSIAIGFNDMLEGYNNITENNISVNGTCIDNIQGTGNTILGNIFYGLKWIDSRENSTFNSSTQGNTYYFFNGSGSWTVFDIHDLNGDGWADYGTDRPFDAATLGDTYWTGSGEDWYPGIVDNENPSIQYSPDTSSAIFTKDNYITINVTAEDVNLINLTIYLYNSSNIIVNESFTNQSDEYINITDLFDGTYYFNATASDSHNRTNSTLTRNITIDTTLPVVYYTSYDSGVIGKNYIELNISVNETNLKNITIRIYNTTMSQLINTTTIYGSGFINITGLEEKTYFYNTTAYDQAGNENNTGVKNATVDLTNPTIQFIAGTDNASIANRRYIQINVTANDAHLSNITINIYNSSNELESSTSYNSSQNLNISVQNDGIYYFNATALDTLGHLNHTETRNVTIDTLNPSIYFENDTIDEAYSNLGYIYINVTANDTNFENVTIEIYNMTGGLVDSLTYDETSANRTYPLDDGLYYFNATAYDKAGNSNSTETRNITIDTINPEIIFASNTDNGTIGRNSTIINVSVIDANIANITMSLYNSSGASIYTSTANFTNNLYVNITGLSDGIYHYNATAYDKAGNYNSTITQNVTINMNVLAITLTPADLFTEANNIFVNISATGSNIENITIRLYNSSGTLINSSNTTIPDPGYNFTSLSDGKYYYNATVYDIFNYSASTITGNTTIDTVNPSIGYNTLDPSYIKRNYTIISVYTVDSNMKNVTIYLYNSSGLMKSNTSGSSNFSINFTNLPDGIYFYNATAYDIIGHYNSSSTMNVTVDTMNPSVSYGSGTDNGTIGRNDIIINVSASDINFRNITLRIYNSSGSLINITTDTTTNIYKDYTVPADGIYYYNATAYDAAGNKNSTGTRNITVDTTLPAIIINEPSNQLYKNNTIDLKINVTSQKVIDKCYYVLNGTTTIMSNCTGATINVSDGIQSLTIYSNDTFGFVGQTTVTFMIDTNNNIIEANSSTIEINATNITDIYIPLNNSVDQIIVSQNVSDDTNVKLYFAGITTYTDQSNITLNSSMNATRNTISAYSLEMPANITITGPANWTGEITIPTVTSDTVSISPSSGTVSVSTSKVIVVGFSQRLNLSNAARIVIGGENGKLSGYDEGSGTIIRITNTCPNATDQDIIDDYLNDSITECSISYGSDLIIWTKHFSRYVTFSETAIPASNPPSPSGSGSSSSGGGGSSSGYSINNTGTTGDSGMVSFSKYLYMLNNGSNNIIIDKDGMPITQMNITLQSEQLYSDDIMITSYKSNPTDNGLNASTYKVYRYITFNDSINRSNIISVKYNLRIDKEWIRNNSIGENISIYRYSNGSWSNSTLCVKYGEDASYVYCNAQTIRIDNLAIAGQAIKASDIAKVFTNESNVPDNDASKNLTEIVTGHANETSMMPEKISLNWSRISSTISLSASKISSIISSGVSSAGRFFTSAKNYAYENITKMNISKKTQSLIVISISSILVLILGIVGGMLIYKNNTRPKIEQKIVTHETIRKAKTKSAPSADAGEELMHYDNETRPDAVMPESFNTDVSGMILGVGTPQHPDIYVREIHELLNRCESALDSGMVEDAQEIYNDARTIYFGSNLNYEQKSVVYVKMMELHGRLSKLQQ